MRRAREEKTHERRRAHLVSWPGAARSGVLAAAALLGGTAQAEPAAIARATPAAPAAQIQPTQPATPQAIAVQRHVDRLAILIQERNGILARLTKETQSGDQTAVARIQADLQAIDREIALVSRHPVLPTSGTTPNERAVAKPVSAVQPANQETQPQGNEKVTYEGWDIFRNFGRKGN